jgi:uncharacterized protein YijF (DUF1287 family)
MPYKELASNLIRMPQQGDPEAIMTWIRLPNGKIRLYASRELHDLAWGQRTRDHGPGDAVVWHMDGDLDHVLIVDRDTAAEALQWVLERWAREDAEKRNEIERKRLAELGVLDAVERKGIEKG